MQKNFETLKKCKLFDGIDDSELSEMLGCLKAKASVFEKGQIVLEEGEKAEYLGIVLSGRVRIIRNDYFGNRSIVADITPSQIFGEAFACAEIEALPISAICEEKTEIMLIDVGRIMQSSDNSCEFHNRIIFNLMKLIARKNLILNEKIEITSKRTTREKLMAYLLQQAKIHNSNDFTISFDRQELADYLEVERSGLSSEIGKLCKEGRIVCEKKHFVIL